jgi:hypothetical protein
MRRLAVAAVLIFAPPLTFDALAQTAQRTTPPKLDETQNADRKAEYLESIPYKPCPASVVFPNGKRACIGGPGYPDSDNAGDGEDRDERNETR